MSMTRVGTIKSFGVVLSALLALSVAGCEHAAFPQPMPQEKVVDDLRKGGSDSDAGETGNAGETAVAEAGTGWGTISGKLVFDGSPPAVRMLPTGGKDPTACHPQGVPDDSLVVDSASKGIKNIVVYARRVSRVNDEYAATESEPVEFDQKGCQFLSHVVAVRTSQPLNIKNSDPVAHNTSITPPADKGANPLLPAGTNQEFQFGRQQNVPVPVSCSIHPWMKAYILPRENPYFAVTDASGEFKLDMLPAGEEVEFQVWHERGNGNQGALAVPGLTDAQGRFKKKVEPDQTLELGAINVPAGNFK
jgi:hypothetical protein